MSRAPRSGVALIIAISVLAALLFLALPFLYSQSASMAGARSAAYDGEARRGQVAAAGLATALAVYAHGLHLSRDYPAIRPSGEALLTYGQTVQVQSETRHPTYDSADPATIVVRFDRPWTQPNPGPSGDPMPDLPTVRDDAVTHGASIQDQSGLSARIDPIALDEAGWARLFRLAGISDPHTVVPTLVANKQLNWQPTSNQVGRLAYGCATSVRNGTVVVGRLEQLVGVQPRRYEPYVPSSWSVPDDIETQRIDQEKLLNSMTSGRTAPLTSSEVELLFPFIAGSLSASLIPTQARSGVIDLGNVVDVVDNNYVLDANQPRSLVPGDRLLGHDLPPPDSRVRGWVTGSADTGMTVQALGSFGVREAIGMAAMPSVNINALRADLPAVRWFKEFWVDTVANPGTYVFDPVNSANMASVFRWPLDPTAPPIVTLASVPQLYLLDPRAGDGVTPYLRPAIAVTNWGLVAVDSAATARDAQGRIQANRRQRTVIQAVPQEHPIEAKWEIQADFEALVRQRHGSWMMAGPRPTNRVANWGVEKVDMDSLGTPGGWLEPAPMSSFSLNEDVFSSTWKASFGLGQPVGWDAVLGNPFSGPTPRVSLQSDGLILKDGDSISWLVGSAGSPVVMTADGDEMNPWHMSMRFRFADAVGDVELVSVRGNASVIEKSFWGVRYVHASSMLVLTMANAAPAWEGFPAGWRVGVDGPDAQQDARCQPHATGSAFAPSWPQLGRQVEFRYKAQLQSGRWYHLQAYCYNDRPGGHGLILDGIVGRDLAQETVTGSLRTGDHCTYPTLRLKEKLLQVKRDDIDDLTEGSVELIPPIDVATGIQASVSDMLPISGLVRIDDEFLSYVNIDGNSLKTVQRGRRERTDWPNGGPKPWLMTQDHPAGALVLPGWSQVLLNGALLQGKTQTRFPFISTPVVETIALSDLQQIDASDFVSYADWPDRGRLLMGGCFAWFQKNTDLTNNTDRMLLHWVDSTPAMGIPLEMTLTSLEVYSLEGFSLSPGQLQLLQDDGRCEWIRYTGAMKDPMVGGSRVYEQDTAFFLHDAGWNVPGDIPNQNARGSARTIWRVDAWPAQTTVLPVQRIPGSHRFEVGDVVTIEGVGDPYIAATRVIRYAGRDAYPTDIQEPDRWEVDNDVFAFTDKAPDINAPLRVIIGRGWNNYDLSPPSSQFSPQQLRLGQMPRRRAMGENPRIVFGGGPTGIVIDDICTGQLRADGNAPGDPGEVLPTAGAWDDSTGTWIDFDLSEINHLPVRVKTAGDVFTKPYGLVSAGGEVFAYRRYQADKTSADLIARGLLGTSTHLHAAGLYGGMPMVQLPMGPVGEIVPQDGLTTSPIIFSEPIDVIQDDYSSYFKNLLAPDPHVTYGSASPRLDRAPALLIAHPTDGRTEVVRLLSKPRSQQKVTAVWLRGLYESSAATEWQCAYDPAKPWRDGVKNNVMTRETWSGDAAPQSEGQLNPIVIGWWPRFAPAMSTSPTAHQLRSRSYTWAGFALRLHGSRFDPKIPTLDPLATPAGPGVADVHIIDSGGGCDFELRALAAQLQTGAIFDWASAVPSDVTGAGLTEPFNWDRFFIAGPQRSSREVDGAELRLTWSVPTTKTGLEAIADAQGRAPRIGTVRLRCVAPTRILSVEEVR